jgi:hypothetical protein
LPPALFVPPSECASRRPAAWRRSCASSVSSAERCQGVVVRAAAAHIADNGGART